MRRGRMKDVPPSTDDDDVTGKRGVGGRFAG